MQKEQKHDAETQRLLAQATNLLEQVTTEARPAEFIHADIADLFENGAYTSRLDTELEDILRGPALTVLSVNDAQALAELHGIAYIGNGEVLSLVDLTTTKPLNELTKIERITLLQNISRSLLNQVAVILDELSQQEAQPGQAQQQPDDDDPGAGGLCYA